MALCATQYREYSLRPVRLKVSFNDPTVLANSSYRAHVFSFYGLPTMIFIVISISKNIADSIHNISVYLEYRISIGYLQNHF